MNRNNEALASRRVRAAYAHLAAAPVRPRCRPSVDEGSELNAIAEAEGWRVPPPEVTRVSLRPWQQAVFWGLRIYIAVLLIVIAVGFAQFAARP